MYVCVRISNVIHILCEHNYTTNALISRVMFYKIMHYTGIVASLAIIIACFLPWAHYNNIDQTFTGFNVTRFSTGNYYGKAGIIITAFTILILIFMILPRLWAKRINLFLTALLFAYCIRTYIIFTSALFEGEVEKRAGIYLIIILSFLMLAASVFPKMGQQPLEK